MSTKGEVELGIPAAKGKAKWKMSKQWERFTHESFKMLQNRTFQIVLILIGLGVAISLAYLYLVAKRLPSQKTVVESKSLQG